MHWNREEKILRLDGNLDTISQFQSWPNVVLVPGCFDLLHYSHIDFLQRARLLGGHLIVALNSDYSVHRAKDGRPIIPEKWRARQLAALEVVEYVIIFGQDTPLEVVRHLHPHVVVVGAEWKNKCQPLVEEAAKFGGSVVYLGTSEDNTTTTALIQRLQKQTLEGNSNAN